MTHALKRPWALDAALRDEYREVLAGWPVPHAQVRLATGAGETFVVACGEERAPPLVLLHGAQSNSATWMFDAAAWSRHFRVFAVDLVGEPGLSAPERPPLDGDSYTAWLDEVLAGLGITRAAVVGMSFGGWVALEYAARRPQRVDRLCLLCPAGIGRQKRFLPKALPLLLLGHWGKARVRHMVMGPAPEHVPEAARPLMALLDRIMNEVRPRTAPIPLLGDEGLRSLRMPVQAIVGGKDPLLDSYDTARRLASCVPHAELRFLPDGHHYLPGQREAVSRFLLQDRSLAA